MDSLSSDNIIFSKEFITLSHSVEKCANRCNLQKTLAMTAISFLCVSGRPSQLSMAFGNSFSLKSMRMLQLQNGFFQGAQDSLHCSRFYFCS